MKERPIIFSSPMIQAILAGRKTQTRRILKHQPPDDSYTLYRNVCSTDRKVANKTHWLKEGATPGSVADGKQPYFTRPFEVGMRLWVKEVLGRKPASFLGIEATNGVESAFYQADGEGVVEEHGFDLCPWWKGKSLSPIHMPRWASRITLEVTDVRVEPLFHITEEDAKAEGVTPPRRTSCRQSFYDGSYRSAFRNLWHSIHGQGAWNLNPWVFAVTFRRIEGRSHD